ncbi:MAG: class I SAM-dependent methyltransferase [Acidobacteria bacterium]|nr:class I SAM-dependent methyltransferase [Acidobacteriota bacterium]
MRMILDTDTQTLTEDDGGGSRQFDLYTREAFECLSRHWVRLGWNQKYQYTFSWMGRPVIQLPEDMIRAQEAIYSVRPDVIVETGVAHGGSLVFYASLCKAIGNGRVIGVDIEIRPHNRAAIEDHDLFPHITLLEGSSTDPRIVGQVRDQVRPGESVMVFLDSNHTRSHVRAELDAYGELVTPGSYLVATDGIMKDLHDVPRGNPSWEWDNPQDAVREFLESHPEFVPATPTWPFNESALCKNVTHWTNAWLRRL